MSDSSTIKNVVNLLNKDYFLPGIQRTFDWDNGSICNLYDSILRNIPIGQITIWTLVEDDEEFENQLYYSIINNYISSDINPFGNNKENVQNIFNNEILNMHSDNSILEIKPLEHTNSKLDSKTGNTSQKSLVIDGQQRLTALNIGLNGCIIDYKSNHNRKKIDNWGAKFLYLNLAKDPATKIDKNGEKVRYEFEFKWADDELDFNDDEYWFRINKITSKNTDYDDYYPDEYVKNYIKKKYEDKYDKEFINKNWEKLSDNLEHNLDTLDQKITRKVGYDMGSVIYSTDETSRYDGGREIVKETFFRLNNLGSTVKKEQKLLAKCILSWAYEKNTSNGKKNEFIYNPRDDIYDYITEFKSKYTSDKKSNGKYFNMNLEFLFECLSAVSRNTTNIKDNKKNTISEKDISNMKKHWLNGDEQQLTKEDIPKDILETPSIKDTLYETHDELKKMGITKKTGIQSTNVLIPIIYFKHYTGADLNSIKNKNKIKKYILATKVSNVIQSSDNWINPILDEINSIINDESKNNIDFPYEQIKNRVNDESNHPLVPVKGTIISNIDNINYAKKNSKLNYILYYIRDEFETDPESEIDHIFKKSIFNKNNLQDKGFNEDRIEKFNILKNSIWNLQLLRKSEHEEKTKFESNRDYKQNETIWFMDSKFEINKKEKQRFIKEYDIPEGIYTFDSFEEFVDERRKSIIKTILSELDVGFNDDTTFESTYKFDIISD